MGWSVLGKTHRVVKSQKRGCLWRGRDKKEVQGIYFFLGYGSMTVLGV